MGCFCPPDQRAAGYVAEASSVGVQDVHTCRGWSLHSFWHLCSGGCPVAAQYFQSERNSQILCSLYSLKLEMRPFHRMSLDGHVFLYLDVRPVSFSLRRSHRFLQCNLWPCLFHDSWLRLHCFVFLYVKMLMSTVWFHLPTQWLAPLKISAPLVPALPSPCAYAICGVCTGYSWS